MGRQKLVRAKRKTMQGAIDSVKDTVEQNGMQCAAEKSEFIRIHGYDQTNKPTIPLTMGTRRYQKEIR